MNRQTIASRMPHRAGKRGHGIVAPHPRSVPIVAAEPDSGRMPDQPFVEGVAHDVIDPDLRHRMISEAAYSLYARRGYADGFDVDDWLTAESEVDHLRLDREAPEDAERAG